jgi:sugar phosphate isomerase/epimerase
VAAIEFSDFCIPRVADDYFEDTLHHRRAPGEGDADLVRFVRTMDAIGAKCPYTLEVISDEIVSLAPAELGERLGRTARSVLETARA